MVKKKYDVMCKFSDVHLEVEAESKEQAMELVNDMFSGDSCPKDDTYCYDLEIEEQISEEDKRICKESQQDDIAYETMKDNYIMRNGGEDYE